jgi:hypothetical protein
MFVRSFDVLHHVLVEINEVVLDHYMIQNYGPESACKGLWYYNCFDIPLLLEDNQMVENYFHCVEGSSTCPWLHSKECPSCQFCK